jgi:pimeloyl-ACP methyl ester carboxylesterase
LSEFARLEVWLASVGARMERVRYPRAGGEAHAVRLVPAGAARGRVVMAHGAGNDALFPLLALCKPLVRAGLEIFAFDLDGHGRHSTTRFAAADAEASLAAAAAHAGPGDLPLHLLGHSLGGSLVLHALSRPGWEGVASAAVLSAPIRVRVGPRVALGELRGFFARATLAQREHYGAWGVVPAVGPLKRSAYPFRRAPCAVGSYVSAVTGLLERLALEDAAPRIRVPVLLVYGDRDALVPPEQGERLGRLIPRAELVRVEGATHWSLPFAPQAVEGVAEWLGAAA